MTSEQLTLPPPKEQISTIAANAAVLWVYDEWPEEHPWVPGLLQDIKGAARVGDVSTLSNFLDATQGAPLGAYDTTSERVSRVLGMVVESGGSPVLKGGAVAHGRVTAHWVDSVEGHFLTLRFENPHCSTWGQAKDELCIAHLGLRLLMQYELQALNLLENIQGAAHANALHFEFSDYWDECSSIQKKDLITTCLTKWTAAHLQVRGFRNIESLQVH
ncbi:hypothetical protein LC612_43810 [Nostoc sp. CHAB 5834]|nr:hypothetical protein [Nostoc sp. CHAB 5834]